MNFMKRTGFSVACALLLSGMAVAATPARYQVTLTNGSLMPISPGAIYVKIGGTAAIEVGSTPTPSFVQLCQAGNAGPRVAELKTTTGIISAEATARGLAPGESRTVTVNVPNPAAQSIHFEGMYGETKDACAVASVNSHSLVALQNHVTSEVVNRDTALQSGAFQNPVLPPMAYPEGEFCAAAKDAITCLRGLAAATVGTPKVRFFAPYAPSLLIALESRYGSAELQPLLFASAGAVQVKVKLVH